MDWLWPRANPPRTAGSASQRATAFGIVLVRRTLLPALAVAEDGRMTSAITAALPWASVRRVENPEVDVLARGFADALQPRHAGVRGHTYRVLQVERVLAQSPESRST